MAPGQKAIETIKRFRQNQQRVLVIDNTVIRQEDAVAQRPTADNGTVQRHVLEEEKANAFVGALRGLLSLRVADLRGVAVFHEGCLGMLLECLQ